jgi:predicted GNAT family acetyltransferase
MAAGRDGIEVVDVPQHQRFDMVGLADYHKGEGPIDFVHTEVDRSRRNQGLASHLVRSALDDVRARDRFKVVPSCSYVARWIDTHPEYHDLLAGPPTDG